MFRFQICQKCRWFVSLEYQTESNLISPPQIIMFARNKINNLTGLISIDFEKDTKIDESIDPYDSVWLKCLTVMVIFVEMSASVIIWAFVTFETRGYAGHYRTAINQLLSCLYGGVSKINSPTNIPT